jgi:hypothetical protein
VGCGKTSSGAAVASLAPHRFGAVNQAVRQFDSVLGVALTVVLVGHAAITLANFHILSLGYAALGVLTALICVCV